MSSTRALGILGGTFNPPHRGHLALALSAREQLGLERVLLVPAHTAPYKAGDVAGDVGPEHRLAMCRLAVAGSGALVVCAVEIERGGVSYTVDTLRELHASHPEAELTLIVGADVASTLRSWREPAQLLALAGLAIAERPGAPRGPVLDTLAALHTEAGVRVSWLQMPAIDASSSLARARVARGEPIEELVGPAVAGYIAEHGLYAVPSEAHV
ncbi:MAG TPA: nicotinate-nucleotide adenylyltransferase [Solirubrobacteraceae bacterium]|nr:nicotinate-nucleotide adenylyltransferase [Solirubrobacteraceae bacterium]